ncbi:MAG: hypothetical protein ACHQ01_01305 [Candidatus Limnocylindrales bacterium]
MDTSRNDQLGELAADASLERADFLAAASAQLKKFLDKNADRIAALGGLVLIDEETDYLAIEGDLTFRSRNPYLDETTGKWVTETEVIDDPSELVELYNLAEVFAAFQDATNLESGLGAEPAAGDQLKSGNVGAADATPVGGENPYAAAADDWAAAGRQYDEPPESEEEAAERLYDLALAFQERSQQTEAHLLEQFESGASQLSSVLGDLIIVDDDDERLTLRSNGSFSAEVVPENETESGTWRKLDGPDDIVEFYDPTDIFGDLADTLAESFPGLGEPAGAAGSADAEGEERGGEDGDAGEADDAAAGKDGEGDDRR